MTQAQHIIVVDDEQPAREMVGDYLRMHGFSVSLCDGGASLRNTIAQQMPDLIVLDLNMPEEDGLSIIRHLKRRTSVPIIMLTATASAIDRVVGLELGADDYLRTARTFGSHPLGVAPERRRSARSSTCGRCLGAASQRAGAVWNEMARPRRPGAAR